MDQPERIFHASHWGAYSLKVQGGQILSVEPAADDPEPSPIVQSVVEWANPARRIAAPMVRKGWLEGKGGAGRGKDEFIEVTWDKALDLVAAEISRVIANHGNPSIFAGSYGWTSAGRFHHSQTLLKRMLGLVGGYTDHVDTYSFAAGPAILRHTLGSAEACWGKSSTLDSIAKHTETLVVFGSLSPRTAQNEAGGLARHEVSIHLRAMVERGVKIILVSPLRDDLPEWVECEWWPIRPNTDTALMLALAGEVVAEGREDQDFLTRATSGSREFLDYLRGAPDATPKTAQWASKITGIAPERIRDLALRMTQTRSMISVSWSLQRARFGEQPFWAAIGLASVLGQVGLEGGGFGFGYGSTGGSGAPLGRAGSPGMSKGKNPTGSFIPVARIADMLLNPNGAYTFEGEDRIYPDTRLVYWAGGNPYHHHQDLNRLEKAWTRPETVIVQDIVWSATALRGDIVLPASSSLERNDIAGNNRTSHFLAMQKAIEPLGQSRSDYEIFCGLAERLGVSEAFTEGRDEMGWIRHLYETSRAETLARTGFQMVDFDTFWAEGRAEVPVKEQYTYLADYRANPAANPLATESGRIVLGSRKLADLALADCPSHPAWLAPEEWLGASDGAELHLISNQPKGRLHSQLPDGPASVAERVGDHEVLRLHPDAAKARGVEDGDLLRVFNTRGECRAVAKLDDKIAAGVVVLPTGGWLKEGGISGNPNVLTADRPSSGFGQGCAAYSCLVKVETV